MISVSQSPQFLSSVESVVDSLCFYNTHAVDTDFKAHTRTALDTIHTLQMEQRQRIDQMYGPAKPTPDQIAEQLEELYRADAQSLGSTPNVVDAMSLVTARLFKREMKIRIHEWEAAFRSMYGRDANPHDKASLRGIYELYKTVKLRVQDGEQGKGASEGGSGSRQPQKDHSMTITPVRQDPTPIVGKTAAGGGAAGASSLAPAPQPPKQAPSTGPSPVVVRNLDISASPAPVPPQQPVAPGQQPPPSSARDHADPTSAQGMDISALIAEKKMLKRKLHQFEEEFRKANGRQPTKEDRRIVGRDYHRYGELKTLLSAQGGKED